MTGGHDLAAVAAAQPWGPELASAVDAAQRQAGHPVRVEFVVQDAHLRILRVTPADLRGAALVAHVAHAWAEGRIDERQALAMVDENELARALAPTARVTGLPVVSHGLGVAPGVASGVAVFSAQAAVAARAEGLSAVLILPVTLPEDLPGLLAATAVVTEHGGSTSHAAVVTRGLGRVCVTALSDARVEADVPCLRPVTGTPIVPGDQVTVDGSTGLVYRGAADPAAPPVTAAGAAPQVRRLLAAADRHAELAVRVNADSPADAEAGHVGGAAGIGLCRIEHMLLGERQPLLARVLMGAGSAATGEALAQLRDLLRADFVAMLTAMSGSPATIRLLDPPRHEFLPDPAAMEIAAAVARSHAEPAPDPVGLAAVRRLRESNPMLGVRGVRLAMLDPLLLDAQLTALVEATAQVRRDGADPRPELLVPMVMLPAELTVVRTALTQAYRSLGLTTTDVMPVGAMVETPRAAIVAGELARTADFLSIGSNDLTSLVWGLSRDDAERELLPRYRDLGLIGDSPAAHWDEDGVGALVRHAVTAARTVKPDISIGICGEQAVDHAAIRLLGQLRIDYVSCSPARLPVVRLMVARAALAVQRNGEAR